jgi:hypothetical protein
MGDDTATFEVRCPCCEARLVIAPAVQAILRHEPPPPKPGAKPSLEGALQAVKGEAARREALFKQAAEAQKGKGRLLDAKFQEALKKAKTEPVEKPTRDIDLD